MNNPHVVALIYGIERRASVDYEEAELFVREEPAFRLEVKDKKARFELKDHYAEESAARESVKEYIRAWEFDACLNNGPSSFKLRFDESEIEDRNPTPGVVCGRVSLRAGVPTISASVTCRVRKYPSPPLDLAISPDVQTMYDRYMNYLQGREPLSGMAFFVSPFLRIRREGEKQLPESTRLRRECLEKSVICVQRKEDRIQRKEGGVTKELTEEEHRF